MIENLRWIEREHREPQPGMGDVWFLTSKQKILQAYDGHVWFDIPVVSEGEE